MTDRLNLQKICGNTYVIGTNLTIPVYYLNEKEAILLDTGYLAFTRSLIDAFTEQTGMRIRAVINSHLHVDHVGNNKYLRERFSAELIAHEIEAAVMTDPCTVIAYYPIGSYDEWKRQMPEVCMKTDRTFTDSDDCIDIDGASFGLVSLPGHTYGHTGIITPDDVFYVGDAVITPEEMGLAKIPTTMNWAMDFASKEKLCSMDHAYYVLAHHGFCEDIKPMAEQNIAARREKLENIYRILVQSGARTMEEMLGVLAEYFSITGMNMITQAMFQRNFQYLLEYYMHEGRVKRGFERGIFVFEFADPDRDE